MTPFTIAGCKISLSEVDTSSYYPLSSKRLWKFHNQLKLRYKLTISYVAPENTCGVKKMCYFRFEDLKQYIIIIAVAILML